MTHGRKNLARSAAVLVASGAIFAGMGAAPASAASSGKVSAPSCVHLRTTSSWATTTTKATNNCSYSVRVYFKWDRHVDGPCTTIGAYGGWHKETVARTARFAGLGNC
ncbi:hypothetical protein FCH28_23680 [Streptomyces piniterrae]|uniref:Uncharacterized protein n=1 Tax=Streptomyces piniterrae TaxID=2571125 RepID=A0A4U0N9Z6_9ACTN|nr:hypothetical protein [Streptomyces piniterrae]TJZ50292.1 hypothetical protein FCH28_23680 [Streptomyces piniterrae]